MEASSSLPQERARRPQTIHNHSQKNGNRDSSVVLVRAATPASSPKSSQCDQRRGSANLGNIDNAVARSRAERLLSQRRTDTTASYNQHDQTHAASTPVALPKSLLPIWWIGVAVTAGKSA